MRLGGAYFFEIILFLIISALIRWEYSDVWEESYDNVCYRVMKIKFYLVKWDKQSQTAILYLV